MLIMFPNANYLFLVLCRKVLKHLRKAVSTIRYFKIYQNIFTLGGYLANKLSFKQMKLKKNFKYNKSRMAHNYVFDISQMVERN